MQEFHSHWRLILVTACFSKETGKESQEMLGRPRKNDWFQDPHNGCSILWAPVAWISKHFLDFNYNSCKILKKKKKRWIDQSAFVMLANEAERRFSVKWCRASSGSAGHSPSLIMYQLCGIGQVTCPL